MTSILLTSLLWAGSAYPGIEMAEQIGCVYENGNLQNIPLDNKFVDNGVYADLSFYIPENRFSEFTTLHAGGFEYLSVRIRFQKNQQPELAFITTLMSGGKENEAVSFGDDIRSNFNGHFEFTRYVSQEQGRFKILCDIIPK